MPQEEPHVEGNKFATFKSVEITLPCLGLLFGTMQGVMLVTAEFFLLSTLKTARR